MNAIRYLAMPLMTIGLMTTAGSMFAGEKTGTVTSDASSYVAKFTLTNRTPDNIAYQIKWGNGEWKNYRLVPGETRAHWDTITNGRYPTPHIRFDNVAGDGKVTDQGYKLIGYEVGYNGYGAKTAYATTPKRYEFQTTVNSRTVNLFSDN